VTANKYNTNPHPAPAGPQKMVLYFLCVKGDIDGINFTFYN